MCFRPSGINKPVTCPSCGKKVSMMAGKKTCPFCKAELLDSKDGAVQPPK